MGQGLSVLRGVVGGCEHSASVEEERAVDADACLRLCSMLEDSDDVLFQVCRLCRRCGCSPLPPRARASVPCLVLIERLQALSCGFAPSLTITASPHHRTTASACGQRYRCPQAASTRDDLRAEAEVHS